MPRNSGGTYTLPIGNPVFAGTTIEANWANTTLSDIGSEVTDSLSRSGEGGMLAALRLVDGTASVPSVAFSNEINSGFYRSGTNEVWVVIGGSQITRFNAAGLSGTIASSNATLTGGSINGMAVGGTTAAAGAFTTLSSSSTTSLNGTTIPASKTLVDTDSAQTLTNKTINASDNTVTNVSLTTSVTGTLPIGNGGTNATTAAGARVSLLPSYTGNESKVLALNSGATDVEWVSAGAGGDAVLANNNAFTGANTFFNGTGQTFGTATSTQDGIIVTGRAGGSSSYRVTMTPGTLTASRTATFPDETFTVGFRNIPAVADKTTSYTLEVADIGKVVGVGSGGSITVPNSTFAAGDAVLIFNNTAGPITITCSITTAYIAGTDADKDTLTLATRGLANILFISGTVCVVTGNVT